MSGHSLRSCSLSSVSSISLSVTLAIPFYTFRLISISVSDYVSVWRSSSVFDYQFDMFVGFVTNIDVVFDLCSVFVTDLVLCFKIVSLCVSCVCYTVFIAADIFSSESSLWFRNI